MKKNISKNFVEIDVWWRLFVRELVKEISRVQFRDHVELQQATKWLHENGRKIWNDYILFWKKIFLGIIVHFEDTLLSNYYFLDPQYLAELLAQLIAAEQTNGLARHGEFRLLFLVTRWIICRINENQWIIGDISK